MKIKLILLALTFFEFSRSVKSADIFDDQPKILVNDGNLILESADSRNVSIHLKGRSSFLINNVEVFNNLKPLDGKSGRVSGPSNDVKALQVQLANLKSTINGRYGVLKRLEQLELGLSGNSSSTDAKSRSRALNRKVAKLEVKVANITERLMINHCKSYPCLNGGTCFNMFETFRCECTDSWQGPTCSEDVNECAKFQGTELGCQNGATCINTFGSYECQCRDQWKGQHCTSQKIDCLSVSGKEICGHGTCVQASNAFGFSCICEQGWRQSIVTSACTVDIDECTEMRPHCSDDPKVMCINTPGSFVCGPCPAGFTGNGFTCDDIDECQTNNGGCSVLPKVECINKKGSSRCGNCPPGYAGDGKLCEPNAIRPNLECADSSICNEHAQCFDYPNLPPACQCKPGYTGNGFGVDGCVVSEVSACSALRCLNGGVCVDNGTSVRCECPKGVKGVLCQLTVDPCDSNPCINGGNCTDAPTQSGYKCSCVRGFRGDNCENQILECGGVCSEENGTIVYPENSLVRNSQCAWYIKTNHTKVLNVTFTKFAVGTKTSCNKESWLQIHDGPGSSSHMIGRFCGTSLPKNGTIISSHNALFLWLRSDNNSTQAGFELNWETIDPICGGLLNVTTHGTIASPGSPGNYPPNRDCEWFIVAPPGKRIQFLFHTLMIEDHKTCDFDYLEVHSGLGTFHTSLGKFCSTTNPPPLTTPSHTATVHFHSDADISDYGFRIAFAVIDGVPGCGGTFTNPKGEIVPPMNTETGKYRNHMDCDFVIQMPANSRVRIEFTKFQLEYSADCSADKIEIFEGNAFDGDQLIGRYCGEDMPPVITSQTNIATIRFHSDLAVTEQGFHLTYQLICGGLFAFDHGTISSPNYPNHYDAHRICEYSIVAPFGQAVVLNVLDFDVERHTDCLYDSLEVFNGIADDSTSLGRFCEQNQLPAAFVSTLNRLTVQFSSDFSNSGRGFLANYSFIDVGCGGIVTNASDVITAPSYTDQDGSFKPKSDCRWLVHAPTGHVIQMTFLNFDLEQDKGCKHDFVTIFNNGSDESEAFGPFCGRKAPKLITTTGNIATIFFHSDSATSNDGFTISLIFIDTTRLCGGHFYSSQGTLKSPGVKKYLNDQNCEWIITAPHNQQIELFFEYFELEDFYQCRSDFLEIRNGGDSTSPLIGTFCGKSVPLPIRSFGHELYLKFVSDRSFHEKGFEVRWDATLNGCGGRLTGMNGSISSPNYPEPYGHDAQCEWQISVNEGYTIEIIFTDLDLEVEVECKSNYLEIFDGDNSGAKSVVVCSAGHQPKDIVTSGNHALLRMVSDVSQAGRGFFLRYTTNCNRTIEAVTGVLESLNFPHNYPNNIDCAWTIVVPEGNRITYQFSHLQMEPNYFAWDHDWLEIKEAGKAEKVKYVNGPTSPKTSLRNEMTVVFHSDKSGAGTGFRMEWYLEGCGGKLTQPEGTFTSPSYSQGDDKELICLWEISVEYGHRIELNIIEIGLEGKPPDCHGSYLIFSNDRDFNDTITKFCSRRDNNHVTTSTGHQLFVKFKADTTDRSRDLKITYKTVASSCGGSFFGRQGVITSPGYPLRNYENNITCEWYLKTDESHTIDLKLFAFMLENSINCTKDFVEIIDPIVDKLLWKACGEEFPERSIIQSERNEMFVRMVTDSVNNSKGFSAEYTTSCGARIVTNSSGMVQYLSEINKPCVWTIISEDPAKKITLTFTHILLFNDVLDTSCLVQIEVFEGSSVTGPLKSSFCKTKLPRAIYSFGDALTIKFHSDNSFHASEFDFYYSVLDEECGGSYSKSMEGEFASPKFPDSSPLNTQCIWTISAASGNQMSLTFNSFDIASSPNCIDSYLEVRKRSQSGELIGVYCGNELPPNISNSESFWIKYQTDGFSTSAGFLAEFKYNQLSELTGSSGIIESPRFGPLDLIKGPQSYRIAVQQGSVIRLEFSEFYVQQYDDFAGHCDKFMEIFNGYDRTAPSLYNENCDRRPESILSGDNVVFILFHRRYRLEAKVVIKWMEVEKVQNSTINGECGAKVILLQNEADVVNITSPGYPSGYEANLNCNWTIMSGDPNYHPVVMIRDVDLEDMENCIGDYLKISADHADGSWKELAKLCSFDIRERLAFEGTPNLLLEFKSDYSENGTGFNVFTFLECGGKMTDSEGVIEYNTSSKHSPRAVYECQWNITVGRGKMIQFEFLEMNIVNLTEICNCFVTIRNGIDGSSPYLGEGQYCGTDLPKLPQTSSNRAYVRFKADYQLKHSFRLRYREVQHDCGGEIRLTHQDRWRNFSTPNYPKVTANCECIWKIIAPVGERIRIDFVEKFELSVDKDCAGVIVEVRDGLTALAPLLGSFCDEKPSTLRSSSNVLMVKFTADLPEPTGGFKVNASIDVCGGTIMSSAGFLTSPKYPANGAYPNEAECEYRIIGKEFDVFEIKLIDLDLPLPLNETHCDLEKDHLVLKSILSDGTFDEIATLCGITTTGMSFFSDSHKLLVSLKSFSKTKHLYRGFRLSYNSTINKCGADISGESGTLTSPGYPSKILKNMDCAWKITVPKGRRVKLEFLDVDLHANSKSFVQRIGLFNDFEFYNRIKIVDSGSELTPVYSSDNKMLVFLSVLHVSNNRGIKLQFSSDEPSICLGNLNENEGLIVPPKDQNLTNYICEYEREDRPFTIGKANVGTIAMRFKVSAYRFDDLVCRINDKEGVYVEIDSGEIPRQSIVVKSCPTLYASDLIVASPFPSLKLVIRQSNYTSPFNFTMNYKVDACGGHFTYPGDVTISNPNTSNTRNLDCAWFFKYEEDAGVFVNITKLQLKMNCTDEYITIYDGPAVNSPVLNILCGSNFPENGLISQKNNLFIHYHTENYLGASNGSIFEFKISSADDRCGGSFSGTTNTGFKTPSYGKSYPPNTECIWEIVSDPGTHIGLSFVDRFFLESSENCSKDYVEVLEFIDSDWRSLGKRCGRHKPEPFNSTTSRMRIIFRSDDSGNGDGFKAVWTQNCGGVYDVTSSPATIPSPGFSKGYQPNLFCNYTFIPPPDKFFNLKFPEFFIESAAPKCSNDNVTIYKSPYFVYDSTHRPLETVGVFCGSNGPPDQRLKGIVTVIFQTDAWVQKPGFTMTYQLEECGGNITTATMITTPKIVTSTGNYLGSLECQWNITAPPGKKIVVKFEKVNLGQSIHCFYDYVELYNGTKVDYSERLAKICGNLTTIFKPIVTESNEALLLWRTDQNYDHISFSAAVYFRPKCDQKVELTSDKPFLLDMTNRNFSESMECIYKFTGEPLSSIKMTFTSINLSICDPDTKLGQCDCDYVEIHDGNGPFSRPIGERFCGYDLPVIPDIVSTGSSLYVRFVTDSIRPSTGFAATFSVVPSPCGSTPFIGLSGNETEPKFIISPVKPGSVSYPPNILCTWIAEAPEGMIFDIQFNSFELENSTNCENDSLTIEDNNIKEFVTEGLGSEMIFSGGAISSMEPSFYQGITGPTAPHVYCGSKLPHDYISESRKIKIHFKTNSENEFRGVNLTLRALLGCSRNFTALTGRLVWTHDITDCKTTIKVPENYTISLFFHRFWMLETDCTKAFLKVYDGTFESGIVLGSTCGYSSPNPMFSTQNQLSLHFNFGEAEASGYASARGFYDILYIATDKGRGCGGEIYNYGGLFSSPMYPNVNRSVYNCTWTVTVPQNLKVALRFSVFDLGSKILCKSDYVEFLEEHQSGVMTSIKKYCGDDVPAVYVSSKSTMEIRYQQTINFPGTGWILNFIGVQEGATPQNW